MNCYYCVKSVYVLDVRRSATVIGRIFASRKPENYADLLSNESLCYDWFESYEEAFRFTKDLAYLNLSF